jgi:site-specific recombinase XerC
MLAIGRYLPMVEPLIRLAGEYVAEKTARGRFTGTTPETVTYTLRGFVPFTDGTTVTTANVESWLLNKPMAGATGRSRLSQVRQFCRWLIHRGHLTADPTLGVEGPRTPRYVPRGLRGDAVGRALNTCPDARARLILLLMCQEGLRCLEVTSIELGDIDFDERLVLVNGKGGHQRVLPVSDETWSALAEYLTEHPARAGPLIRSYVDPYRGIDPGYVSTLVARWLRAAGVEATAHALRHTAASDMLRSGAHLRDVQAALGHVSLSTTQRYLPWLVGDLRTAMAGRKYRGPVADEGGRELRAV